MRRMLTACSKYGCANPGASARISHGAAIR